MLCFHYGFLALFGFAKLVLTSASNDLNLFVEDGISESSLIVPTNSLNSVKAYIYGILNKDGQFEKAFFTLDAREQFLNNVCENLPTDRNGNISGK